MRKIVTHKSCDIDGITSIWLIKRFLAGWSDAKLDFVPAGMRISNSSKGAEEIEMIDGIETIHVDTGMGVLDHHQEDDNEICAASLTLAFVLKAQGNSLSKNLHKLDSVKRIVDMVIDVDHFQEVFYHEPLSDIYEFSLVGIIDGFRLLHPKDDNLTANFGLELLDNTLANFENLIWAEEEIKEKGIEFETKFGKCLAVETSNDDVLKLAQKMGYIITVRQDPKYHNIRIKTRPALRKKRRVSGMNPADVDLTPVYEQLKKKEPQATWFLHVSKRMLLNGSSKNPTMKSSKLSLVDVVSLIKEVYR